MKTIQVSDEDYEFLKNCINELKTQDKRHNINPIYTIWHKVKEYGCEEDSAYGSVYYWNNTKFTLEELFTYLDKNRYEDDLLDCYNSLITTTIGGVEVKSVSHIKYTEDIRQILKNIFINNKNNYELDDWLNEHFGIYKVFYNIKNKPVIGSTCYSFFAKDAFEHIEKNKCNIKGEVYAYVDSLFLAPRMEKLLQILHNLELKD